MKIKGEGIFENTKTLAKLTSKPRIFPRKSLIFEHNPLAFGCLVFLIYLN